MDILKNLGICHWALRTQEAVTSIFISEKTDFQEFCELKEKVEHSTDICGVPMAEDH
jgi:hypothetical protein